jgi:hypothetical protein
MVQGLMDEPWPVFGMGAGGDAPGCLDWGPVDQDVLACRDDSERPDYVNKGEDPILHFPVAGSYAAWRFWVGDGKLMTEDDSPNMAGPVAFGSATVVLANSSC